MQDTLLELLVAPITVGVIVSLFTYWLNDDND
ncbi:MAG: type I toxin-antitoxin system Fst family toxin [Jeotgalicoccus halophilus]|nr:type I toxin-antitoxin system Fst family toxin [Jeotgalicoccus aerolatus]NMA80789.1 type I toxin-antitoxin system Fst family toxin [Jeotgalicoccus aerolatus]